MLVLSRKQNESITIRDNIVLTVVDIRGDKVRLGIQTPEGVETYRKEIYDALQKEKKEKEGEEKVDETQKADAPPEVRLIIDDVDNALISPSSTAISGGPAETGEHISDTGILLFDDEDDEDDEDTTDAIDLSEASAGSQEPSLAHHTPPEQPVRIEYPGGQQSPEEPLHYEPGVYACVSVDRSQFTKLTDHIDIRSWFPHDKMVHPHPVAPDEQEDDSVMLWLRDEDMNKENPTLTKYRMSGAPLSSVHVKVGDSQSEKESIDMRELGVWIHIDADGTAITIEKQYDSMNPPDYHYVPDGKWMGNLVLKHPDPNAVQRYIKRLRSQIADAIAKKVDAVEKKKVAQSAIEAESTRLSELNGQIEDTTHLIRQLLSFAEGD